MACSRRAHCRSTAIRPGLDRRDFLLKSGLGGAVALTSFGSVKPATAAGTSSTDSKAVIRKNICTHCSVGCSVNAEVVNGVWLGQEPEWRSPINRGTHCAKGASIRELVGGERRLKYPLKLEDGQWKRISWDQAIDEVGAKLMDIRREERRGFRLLAGLGEIHQRSLLSAAQDGRVLGDEQRRSPGPHLSFNNCCRRRQHMGIRRADQFLQRHSQREDHDHHGRQSGRGTSRGHAARARRQGTEPREYVRYRSAVHAHGGARQRIRPHSPGHGHSRHLGHVVAHLPEQLGRQGIHPAARLWTGCGAQGGRKVDA